MSTLNTLPGNIDTSTVESAPYNFDVTPILSGAEVLQSNPAPTAVISNNTNGAVMPGAVSGIPAVSGNLVQVTIISSVLQVKQQYTLLVTFYTSSTKKLSFITNITVVD